MPGVPGGAHDVSTQQRPRDSLLLVPGGVRVHMTCISLQSLGCSGILAYRQPGACGRLPFRSNSLSHLANRSEHWAHRTRTKRAIRIFSR